VRARTKVDPSQGKASSRSKDSQAKPGNGLAKRRGSLAFSDMAASKAGLMGCQKEGEIGHSGFPQISADFLSMQAKGTASDRVDSQRKRRACASVRRN